MPTIYHTGPDHHEILAGANPGRQKRMTERLHISIFSRSCRESIIDLRASMPITEALLLFVQVAYESFSNMFIYKG